MIRIQRLVPIIVPVLFMLLPDKSAACPSCFGDPESPMTDGMNAAILFLLTVTGVVLAAVSLFFLYLRKRWVRLNRQFQHMVN